jgi:hypothetical protein
MSTITDADLTMLLEEAASSYDVPEHGPDEIVAAVEDQPVPLPIVRRRWVQLAAAAVVVAGAAFAVSQQGTSSPSTRATAAERSLAGLKADAPALAAPGTAVTDQSSKSFATDATGTHNLAGSGTVAGTASGGVGGSASGAVGASGGGAAALSAPVPAAAAARAAQPLAPTAVRAPAAAGQVTAPVGGDDADSRVVKTGSIALVVKDGKVTVTLTAVEREAKQQGGYIASGNTEEYGATPSGEVTIRVPVAHFETLVTAVRGLDAKVRTASTSGRDVTAQYSDLQAQLRTLTATRERFYLILTKTTTIGEILTVQQRIDDVSGQIDRIQGQRKLLADQSDLSTLTVSVSEAVDPVVKATTKPRSGISQAFHDAWDGFVSGVESIIARSGRALLVLICIGLLLLIARGGWRVARRRMV